MEKEHIFRMSTIRSLVEVCAVLGDDLGEWKSKEDCCIDSSPVKGVE